MELIYPAYYHTFSCIAAACSDSCCKEWDVDVDSASAAYYRSLPGTLGDRLRQVLRDTQDGTVMTTQQGRCPMWQQDGLCRIQAELGHDALCQVCQQFPRLRHDYGNFAELGLELSCPEAARLILTSDEHSLCREEVPGDEEREYDTGTMDILLHSRSVFLDFLEATDMSFPQALAVLLLYAHEVQAQIDGGEPAQLLPETFLREAAEYAGDADPTALMVFFQQLEILTSKWQSRLQAPPAVPCWMPEHFALLRYLLNRYWLQAVSDFDILCRAKFMVAACLLVGFLGGQTVETAQLFSKEIENNPDNVEQILDGAYSAPALTDVRILGLLLGNN
ncbi:MAG: flagellin lysine-N-methylase [Oscillospiraceae bacterium]|nr:flagellin lysine-N-methylase [Oscillospiraceae bacterium]